MTACTVFGFGSGSIRTCVMHSAVHSSLVAVGQRCIFGVLLPMVASRRAERNLSAIGDGLPFPLGVGFCSPHDHRSSTKPAMTIGLSASSSQHSAVPNCSTYAA